MSSATRRCTWPAGLLGVRVGEASHPGPGGAASPGAAAAAADALQPAQRAGPLSRYFQAPAPAAAPAAAAPAAAVQRVPRCPLCPGRTVLGDVRALFCHVSMVHAGALLDQAACRSMHALGRGMCTSDGCGALRDLAQSRCRRCRRSCRVRHLQPGDSIPQVLARASGADDDGAMHGQAARDDDAPPLLAEPPLHADRFPPLPEDFLPRVAALPVQTMLHVPRALRARLCEVTAALIEGCNSGDATFAALEQARTKLLLAVVPRTANAAQEMRARFAFWDARDFVQLLERAEAQASAFAGRRAGPNEDGASSRAARGRRMAQSGAFRKAVQSQITEVAAMSADDERAWAAKLLPCDGGLPRAPDAQPAAAVHDDDVDPAASPLEGVRFAALSGPGPSGARPEHLRDMLNCGRRRVANRLLRALQVTEALAAAGRLPDAWRWMLDSRLVYIKKKGSATPRPIRVGELWRRVISKWLLHRHVPTVREAMLKNHQYGASVPGGREAVVHARRTFREVVQACPELGVWAEVDIDFINAFPSLLWGYIGDAVAEFAPGLAAWTEWCHSEPTRVTLPCGSEHSTDRGSEQGDPHSSAQCGAALAVVRRRAAEARAAQRPDDPPGAFDFWYADDGQAFMRPPLVDLYLRTVDAEAACAGCTRGRGDNVKSSVTLIGHPDAIANYGDEWITDHVRDTCKLREPNAPVEVLGALIGSHAETAAQFDAQLGSLRGLHAALEPLADPAVELTLGRACADLCKMVHLLRIHGDVLYAHGTHEHDDIQRDFVARVLGGDLPPEAARQAEMGVRDGGLGYRRADDHALLAFVASRVETRPYVAYIFDGMAAAGLPVGGCMAHYDAQVAASVDGICAHLGGATGPAIRDLCSTGAETADVAFQDFLAGRRSGAAHDGEPAVAGGLVDEYGSDDHEHPGSPTTRRLQRSLASVADDALLGGMSDELIGESRWHDVRRISDLRDKTTSHEWLWALDPRTPRALEPDAYVAAVRLRLGAGFADAPATCRACGRQQVCSSGAHALCCAPGPSTVGHNEVRDLIHAVAKQADPAAETEVLGILQAAPGLRPADILTNAASEGLLTALDVGVASPDAVHAGDDCLEAMRARKARGYARFEREFDAQGMAYRPITFSCWGREHPDTTVVLESIARRAARRCGISGWRTLLRRLRGDIGAALARRAAAMLRTCFLSPAVD